jgi:hypothetical protein
MEDKFSCMESSLKACITIEAYNYIQCTVEVTITFVEVYQEIIEQAKMMHKAQEKVCEFKRIST